jgi:delta 1-pyrroline-5-carboxylate dehydrogenase
LAPALATGCAIVFKAAEQTPLSTLKFAELFATIGYASILYDIGSTQAKTLSRVLRYPAGALNFVNGLGRITGEAMASHKDIDKVCRSISCEQQTMLTRSLTFRSLSLAPQQQDVGSPFQPRNPT